MGGGREARRAKDRRRGIVRRAAVALLAIKGAFDNIPVTAKLWLGFGAVCGVVAALGLVVSHSVKRLEDTLGHATAVAEPLSAAAYEMEINAIGSGMGVLTYLHTPDAAFVARFREDQEEFEAFHRVFDSVAPGPQARELGQRAAQTYDAFKALGASLIESKDREISARRRLSGAVLAFDHALEKSADGVGESDDTAILTLISRVKNELAGFSFWLTLQLDAADLGDLAALKQRSRQARERLKGMIVQLVRSEAASSPSSLDAGLEQVFEIVDEILAIKYLIESKLPAFSELRRQLDGILDEEVQIFAQAELLETQRRANQISGELRFWLIASEALILILASVTVLAIAKGIIEPVRALRDGTQALESGKLNHRISIVTGDEIGQLVAAFNRMAARLQGATETLEAEVRRRTADLCETQRSLEQELSKRAEMEKQLQQFQSMNCLGSFATGIAHDFNNLICVILGSIRMAREALGDDSRAQAQLARALEAGDRSKTLVQKILTFLRQEPPDLKPLQFDKVIGDALDFLRALLPPSVELTEDVPDDCGMVLGDAALLEQVIVNLGVNAMQAMKEDGGSIHVTARRVELEAGEIQGLSESIASELVELTMSDTGVGIPPEILSQVTNPFFTTKPTGRGTGLGLYMAQRIIASHGGTMALYANPGEGTAVRVLLPLSAQEVLVAPKQKVLGQI